MTTTTYYADYGVRTKQGIYLGLAVMVIVALNTIALSTIRATANG